VKFLGFGAGARVLARVLDYKFETAPGPNKLEFLGRKQ